MEYRDYMVRATAGNAQIRAFAATTKDLADYGRRAHGLSPIATAALGRLMTGTVMMGQMMDNDSDMITVKMDGDGPLKSVLATADNKGNVKGYVSNPYVIMEPNAAGHLNVGGGIGEGTLTVIRDMGLKEPYVGQVPLYSGEVAEDLTYYFTKSEQTPSSVGLGVLVERENLSVIAAGGFIVQLMPFADEQTITHLEFNLGKFSSVTDILKAGKTPEDMLKIVLDGFDIEFTDTVDLNFYCNCDKDRVERALMLVGKKDIQEMIDDGKDIEIKCHFCNKAYTFSVDELKAIKEKAK
ncbi:molecular chaperone Hsp33 [Butyrivibrio proteoclasticus B316]|uniref:33 kDa chaperonin n=1 Tax=Butyrivibrio proteoclasticus (strain ATCC 51982 / DSM 14932 / B316) TaxID=515622 RepID=E0S2B7_BUTPB|nr:Hsp33 family molecular chaperone HslO [Butyrivibrio proteoclasticus]ADL33942.1 molecular chaperone Hsp33 [Butyrivibrio proteoclasticus B316]